MLDEVRPSLAATLPIDSERQLMTGHSFGGLFTLHALIVRPDAFSHYLISSPSIWYGEGAVLDGRPGFAARLQRLDRPPRVFMAVGRDEQPYPGNQDRLRDSPAHFERLRYRRMVDNLEETAGWLRAQGLVVEDRVALHADHDTAKVVNLIHGLRYLLGSEE